MPAQVTTTQPLRDLASAIRPGTKSCHANQSILSPCRTCMCFEAFILVCQFTVKHVVTENSWNRNVGWILLLQMIGDTGGQRKG